MEEIWLPGCNCRVGSLPLSRVALVEEILELVETNGRKTAIFFGSKTYGAYGYSKIIKLPSLKIEKISSRLDECLTT